MNDDFVFERSDNGTMPKNVASFANNVVGRKIVSMEKSLKEVGYFEREDAIVFTLDDGSQVELVDSRDCCAFTILENVVEKLPSVDHVITDVVSSDGYSKWHILADFGEILELQVNWSAGNPFFYSYGFDIRVKPVKNS